MRKLALFAALILLPMPLLAMESSFYGQRPETLNGRELKVATGVEPGTPGVFEFPDAATAVLRAGKEDEEATAKHPMYRFEWLTKDKQSARFFLVTPTEEIDKLRKQNDAATTTSEGRTLENSIVMAYINKGAVLHTCMNNDRELPEALTMYVTLTPGQPQATAVIVPEGVIAECVLTATERGTYPAVKAPTTARLRIALTR